MLIGWPEGGYVNKYHMDWVTSCGLRESLGIPRLEYISRADVHLVVQGISDDEVPWYKLILPDGGG